jgi:hypothetical protein
MNSDAMRAPPPLVPNGAALGAVLAAGLGAFTLGLLVIAGEAGVFVAPTMYGPAGGLSGRSTLAALVWLIAWGMLHARWRNRDVAVSRVLTWSLVLVLLAVAMTFPPTWGMLP